ncbi:hypothetical protein E5Q_03855 [Mixia osmundae IAM 14324]|uniref:Choline/carnitine acyltransferase domain-containing protein n=2 Tax=Mixia osmundae (strain CBS 9802 / IAM 14324 / JCM 22182 / KY 12970) TaxID=764103 RepID=G7E2Z8_MIXOS|nr:hypothetical protein E5Q_03855 [Mixia osmundae IAM 14324]
MLRSGATSPRSVLRAIPTRAGLAIATESSTSGKKRASWADQYKAFSSAARRMFAVTPYKQDQVKTFAHQKTLPRLPVPALESSLSKYVKSLRPLLLEQARQQGHDEAWVEAEMTKREDIAKDFLQTRRHLQQRLIDIDRATPSNWLDDHFWIRVAYHSWRVPLPVNSNWWILMAHDQDVPKAITDGRPLDGEFTDWQVKRAAGLTWRLIDFKRRLDTEEILPDGSRAGPFDMHQYTRIYGVNRVPRKPFDLLTHAPHPHPARHILLIIRDQFYRVDVIDEAGRYKSQDEIESAYWGAVADVKSRSGADLDAPVGLLTGNGRDTWTDSRERLLAVAPENRQAMSLTEDALITVALDDWTRVHDSPYPSSLSSELKQSTTGDVIDRSLDLDSHVLNSCAGRQGHNRWFDKAVGINVESNSRATMMGEHSPCDALIPSIVCDYALAEGCGKESAPAKPSSDFARIRWKTDEGTLADIKAAEAVVDGLVKDSDGQMLWFDEYGVDWIKKSAKQSPDAYLQQALQLAWFKDQGKATATYETASTRLFLHGRTDVIRSFSEDSWRWVQAMTSGKSDSKTLYDLLTKATQYHNQFTRESSMGKGFDRHLLGLKLVLQPGESHPLFEDELFSLSQEWKLSTSGLSAGDRFFGTGFGTVWPDGYGINYLAGNKIIKFGIESKKSCPTTSTHKFRTALAEALREMRAVCEEAAPASTPPKL